MLPELNHHLNNQLITDEDFEEELKENLLFYTANPEVSGKDLFQMHREISIARYALTQQAKTYAKCIDMLTTILYRNFQTLKADSSAKEAAQLLSSVMQAVNDIESRSEKLIDSVKKVTEIIGKIVDIDVDKAALKSMLINLPSLVKESIEVTSNDPALADKISSTLSQKITDLMIAVRFTDTSILEGNATATSTLDGVMDQVTQMIQSVPSGQVIESPR